MAQKESGRMTTDFSEMELTNLDLVYAVSQQNLNFAVAATLVEATPTISFAFANVDGNWVPATSSQPAGLTFSGTWAPAIDANGNLRLPVIDMSSGNTLPAGQVILNLTFAAGATLADEVFNRQYVQPDPADDATPLNEVWVLPMTVSLSDAALEAADIPPAVRSQLDILNQQYGDIFSVQQVLADLATLAVHETLAQTIPAGVDSSTWSFFLQCFGLYVQDTEFAGNLPLAYLIQQQSGSAAPSPTPLTPTSADFVIVPNAAQPDLSALVFVMMTENRTLPPAPADVFEGIGFTDPNATGLLVVRQVPFSETIVNAVNQSGIPATMSFLLNPVAPVPPDAWASFVVTPNPGPEMQLVAPTSANKQAIAAFSYNGQSNGGQSSVTGQITWGASSAVCSSVTATLSTSATAETPSSIDLNGWTMIKCNASTSSERFASSQELEPTTYQWSVSLQLQDDDVSQGQIDFNEMNPDFNSPPVTQGVTGLEQFLAAINDTNLNASFNNIGTTVGNQLSTNLQSDLTTALAVLQSFVLPGNDVFNFSGVFINQSCNLVVGIQYRDPS
jgi:hypothetical protein